MKLKFLLLAVVLLFTTGLYAMGVQNEVDISNPASLVAYLTPFIVLAVTWLARIIKPGIPGWATMVVVMILSTAVTWLTNQLGNPDMTFIQQFLIGLGATFVHQFKQQITDSSE